MIIRPLGTTGLSVSCIGLGAGRLGDAQVPEKQVEELLDAALEVGISVIDTARGYGLSEERLGRLLGSRRDGLVLSTKAGYGVEGEPDWTGETLRKGIERALRTLCTDRIDVLFLHSCPGDVASRDDILRALEDAKAKGNIRAAGYSGENEDLATAVATGAFGVVQVSVSPWDQATRLLHSPRFAQQGLGVFAKRPLAAAPWLGGGGDADDVREYRARFEQLAIAPGPLAYEELAIRFAAHAPGVSTALAGTTSPARLRRLAAMAERGPLPEEVEAAVTHAWQARGQGLRGVV